MEGPAVWSDVVLIRPMGTAVTWDNAHQIICDTVPDAQEYRPPLYLVVENQIRSETDSSRQLIVFLGNHLIMRCVGNKPVYFALRVGRPIMHMGVNARSAVPATTRTDWMIFPVECLNMNRCLLIYYVSVTAACSRTLGLPSVLLSIAC